MRLTDRLGLRAVREAARVRSDQGIEPAATACPFDIAERLGIVVWLKALPSLEGMLTPGPPATAVLNVERPWGRIRHTCAHEIGHLVFGHGLRLDEVDHGRRPGWHPHEFVADRFAAALLMPKLVIASALVRRGWTAASLTPTQAFSLAQDLGVGYRNLVAHLERTLRMITPGAAGALRSAGRSLRVLRCRLAGFEPPHDVFPVDEHWGDRPVDMETGDVAVVPRNTLFCGSCALRADDPTPHIRGVAPGEGYLMLRHRPDRLRVRVSRRDFTGLARYRHLPEYDDA